MFQRQVLLPLLATITLWPAPVAPAQSSAPGVNDAQTRKDAPSVTPVASATEPTAYHRPGEREKFRTFAFDAFGPYPFLTAALAAGYQQARDKPPDWGEGWDSLGTRFGSDYGIQLITTTTRYALAEVFREDTVYYRCSCAGFTPRLKHAVISTVTARRGEDGHRVFSLAALGAPYAGTMTAVLGWYPGRYGAMDGFRIGNYNLAAAAAENVALEFIYGGPHTLLGRRHIPIVAPRSSAPNSSR